MHIYLKCDPLYKAQIQLTGKTRDAQRLDRVRKKKKEKKTANSKQDKINVKIRESCKITIYSIENCLACTMQ